MKKIKLAAVFLVSTFLFGCSSDAVDDIIENDENNNENAEVRLTSLTITGTSVEEAGVVPLDTEVNNGEFSVNYTYNPSDTIGAFTVVLSEDNYTEGEVSENDIEIDTYYNSADINGGEYTHDNLRIWVDGEGEILLDGNDTSTMIASTPWTGYLLVTACVFSARPGVEHYNCNNLSQQIIIRSPNESGGGF